MASNQSFSREEPGLCPRLALLAFASYMAFLPIMHMLFISYSRNTSRNVLLLCTAYTTATVQNLCIH